MLKTRILTVTALAAVLAVSWVGVAISQEQPRPDDKRGERKEGERKDGERGRFQRMSPEEMQKRMEEFRAQMSNRTREQFGASEDEWKVLGPKIEKVQQLSREARGGMGFGGMMFGRSRGGDRGGPRPEGSADRPQSEIEKTGSQLRTVLQKEGATAAEIKSALDAYRAARSSARQALENARKELKELLTTKQEAQAVMMGVLE